MDDKLSDFPTIVKDWDHSRNTGLQPESLAASSNKKIWWVCGLGHSWEASPAQRTKKSTGCPYCANQRAWPGFNDLLTECPEIASQWHPELNGSLLPTQVTKGSNKKVWWLCERGHNYDTEVWRRVSRGTGCRICSGNQVLAGFNDLESRFPNIARDWHRALNAPVRPDEVSYGSPSKKWWKCPEYGHEYQMRVSARTGPKKGRCPFCSNQALLPGFNDLGTTSPKLAEQWDYEKNHPSTPADFARSSRVEVWWKCPNAAHSSFRAAPRNRVEACGICLGQTLMTGFNDVGTKNPELSAQWHPTKNGTKTPQNTLAGGRQKVWWLCEEGHDWEAGIYTRTRNGCPFCGSKRLWPGFNDLLSVNPELAAEWHPTKNGELSPNKIMSSVATKVWWLCPRGHAYQASPNDRSRIGANGRRGCSICAGKVVVRDINHLSVTHPELWRELVKEDLLAERLDSIFAGTVEKVLWRCSVGHEWKAIVYSRARAGNGCPDCANFGFKPDKPAIVYFLRNDGIRARKIGITNTHTKYDRVRDFVKNQGWEEIARWAMVGRLARAVESQAFRWIRGELELPQAVSRGGLGRIGGETETFPIDGPRDDEIVEYLERLAKETSSIASQE